MTTYRVTANALNIRCGPGTQYAEGGMVKEGAILQTVEIPKGWVPVLWEKEIRFVSTDYLEEIKPPAAGEPPWIKWLRDRLGLHEVPGTGDNPEIVAWLKLTQVPPSMYHDVTPWCAATVNAALYYNGFRDTVIHSAAAVDWLKFGQKVTVPQLGDVVVFDWGNGGHHVAFYLADAGAGVITCIGGNQSDAVTITNFPKRCVMGYRRPA